MKIIAKTQEEQPIADLLENYLNHEFIAIQRWAIEFYVSYGIPPTDEEIRNWLITTTYKTTPSGTHC